MEVAATKRIKSMTSKTLLLAAAAVLSLGIGSAFADSDGSGINTYRPAPTTSAAHHAMAGQAAGDATMQAPASPNRNSGGGGG
jgi:hypothetical protein